MIDKERLKNFIRKGESILAGLNTSHIRPKYVESDKFFPWKTQVLNYLEHEIGINSQYYNSFKSDVNQY